MYKILCVVLLCLVYDGESVDVSKGCGSYYGFGGNCVPQDKCQPSALMRTLDGRIQFCNVRTMKNMVCCWNPLINHIPIVANFNYLSNFFLNFLPSPNKTPSVVRPEVSTHSVHYWSFPSTTERYTWPTSTFPRWTTTSTTSTTPRTTSTTPSTTSTTTTGPVATTTRPRPGTTEYVPPVYDYVTNQPLYQGCRDLDPELTAQKIGRKAWDKCLDYQQLVYPCERSVALLGNMVRLNHCQHSDQTRGKLARPNEYPHMVVVGTRRSAQESLRWACTGTLLSERFILTSGHCWANLNSGIDLYAVLGTLQRIGGINDAYQEHRIESIVYPYRSGYKKNPYASWMHHDIALLKTATVIRLDQWAIPACLDVFGKHSQAVATRWRARSWNDNNRLQTVFLHQLKANDYQEKFSSVNLRIQEANQIGYGAYGYSNDNCRYDNETAVIVENQRINCMYTVVGVLSNVGATCGNSPAGSYTRILDYTPWIEQTVWPDDDQAAS